MESLRTHCQSLVKRIADFRYSRIVKLIPGKCALVCPACSAFQLQTCRTIRNPWNNVLLHHANLGGER